MTCSQDAARLIPWYAAGTIEPDSRALVERHLRDCAECRESLAVARDVTSHGTPEGLAEHVHAELLADFVREPERLDRDTLDWIGRHLEECASCAEIAGIVRELPIDAAEPRSAADPEATWVRRTWDSLRATILRPELALAYLVLLVVGLPLYDTLVPRAGPTSGTALPDASGPLEIAFLDRPSRGDAGVPSIPLPGNRPLLYLAIEPELPEGVALDQTYRIEIRGGRGTVWTHALDAGEIRRSLASDQLAVVLAVPAAAVPPGRYTLRVQAVDGEGLLLEVAFETVANR